MEIKFNKLEEEERRIFSKWGKKHSEEGLLKVLPPAKFVKYIGIDLMPDYLFIFIRTVSSLLVLLYFSSWELRELLYDATVFSCLNTPDFFSSTQSSASPTPARPLIFEIYLVQSSELRV